MRRSVLARFLILLGGGCFALACFTGCPRADKRVVLYSAQDREFAERALGDFERQTGLSVTPKFDSESNKSVSLFQELLAEKDRPRCDVFWNNEILSTIRLARRGMLEPYECPSAKPYPASAKAEDHTWHAFAARARILIVNTRLVKASERPASLLDLTQERWHGRIVMARPQFGTSATQAACLFEVLGADAAKQFYTGLKANAVRLAPGNKQVAEWVGRGQTPLCQPAALGITDTDDAMDEVRAGRDVAIVYPDRAGGKDPRMGTLFIPNTLAILKGCPNPQGARRLVDFLLSPAIERQLAEGDSCQVPLNPEVKAKLPRQIETPQTVRAMKVDFGRAAELWDDAAAFVAKEFPP